MKRLGWMGFLLLHSSAVYATEGADSRPNEDALFGEPSSSEVPSPKPPTASKPPQQPENRDEAGLRPADLGHDAFSSGEVVDDPLKIGGRYYQRMVISGQQGNGITGAPLALPLQFDGFMDVRPNDRLRGYIDARLLYDPSKDQYSRSTSGSSGGSLAFSSSSTAPSSLSGGTTSIPNNPQVVFNEGWLKFDIDRTVFVTAGKQHVKWGAGRYWNPTDFLHTQRRDPLLPFDLRLGNMLAKFEVPWESKKTNFYFVGLFDNPQPASTLGQVGGAFRVEKVFGTAEMGIEGIFRGGQAPVYGADLSMPLGPLDFFTEIAYFSVAPWATFQLGSIPTTGSELSSLVSSTVPKGPMVQVSMGTSYSFAWNENRQATLGVEYFYNQHGYNDPQIYPALIFYGQYQPFYTGKNYAALYLTAEGPDAAKHTNYTFSTLGNLSDMSFISRVDLTWRVLTYLTFDSYLAVHYGTSGGEFNFSLNTPAMTFQGSPVAALSIPLTSFDLGAGLRLSF